VYTSLVVYCHNAIVGLFVLKVVELDKCLAQVIGITIA